VLANGILLNFLQQKCDLFFPAKQKLFSLRSQACENFRIDTEKFWRE
jgi:hypothetical protein